MAFFPNVLATSRFVVENARYVTIDRSRVEGVADHLATHSNEAPTFDCNRHLCGTDPEVANFVLVLDTLNFSFWPDPERQRWTVTYGGETLNGYWALVAALRRALANGVPLTNAAFLAAITPDELG